MVSAGWGGGDTTTTINCLQIRAILKGFAKREGKVKKKNKGEKSDYLAVGAFPGVATAWRGQQQNPPPRAFSAYQPKTGEKPRAGVGGKSLLLQEHGGKKELYTPDTYPTQVWLA